MTLFRLAIPATIPFATISLTAFILRRFYLASQLEEPVSIPEWLTGPGVNSVDPRTRTT